MIRNTIGFRYGIVFILPVWRFEDKMAAPRSDVALRREFLRDSDSKLIEAKYRRIAEPHISQLSRSNNRAEVPEIG